MRKKSPCSVLKYIYKQRRFFMKKPAMMEIDELLQSTGMSETEVDFLMARFLEEEAFDYVECMKLVEPQKEETYFA